MKYRKLGKTGLEISEISIGTEYLKKTEKAKMYDFLLPVLEGTEKPVEGDPNAGLLPPPGEGDENAGLLPPGERELRPSPTPPVGSGACFGLGRRCFPGLHP